MVAKSHRGNARGKVRSGGRHGPGQTTATATFPGDRNKQRPTLRGMHNIQTSTGKWQSAGGDFWRNAQLNDEHEVIARNRATQRERSVEADRRTTTTVRSDWLRPSSSNDCDQVVYSIGCFRQSSPIRSVAASRN